MKKILLFSALLLAGCSTQHVYQGQNDYYSQVEPTNINNIEHDFKPLDVNEAKLPIIMLSAKIKSDDENVNIASGVNFTNSSTYGFSHNKLVYIKSHLRIKNSNDIIYLLGKIEIRRKKGVQMADFYFPVNKNGYGEKTIHLNDDKYAQKNGLELVLTAKPTQNWLSNSYISEINHKNKPRHDFFGSVYPDEK